VERRYFGLEKEAAYGVYGSGLFLRPCGFSKTYSRTGGVVSACSIEQTKIHDARSWDYYLCCASVVSNAMMIMATLESWISSQLDLSSGCCNTSAEHLKLPSRSIPYYE
jgi:hypothetical protein